MATKPIRNNDHYLDLLKREHPVRFGEYKAGKYPTVEKALIAAGVKTKRTPLQEMLNGWKKASTSERDAFLRDIGVHMPSAVAAAPAPTVSVPFSLGRRLQPEALEAIKGIMGKRAMSTGDIMSALGRTPLNPSLGMAINGGSKLQQDLIDDLDAWVAKH